MAKNTDKTYVVSFRTADSGVVDPRSAPAHR